MEPLLAKMILMQNADTVIPCKSAIETMEYVVYLTCPCLVVLRANLREDSLIVLWNPCLQIMNNDLTNQLHVITSQ